MGPFGRALLHPWAPSNAALNWVMPPTLLYILPVMEEAMVLQVSGTRHGEGGEVELVRAWASEAKVTYTVGPVGS